MGDGVNIAAALKALSQSNGVYISKSVYDLVVPKTKLTFNDLEMQKVKQKSVLCLDHAAKSLFGNFNGLRCRFREKP